jgi:hypothetical protein
MIFPFVGQNLRSSVKSRYRSNKFPHGSTFLHLCISNERDPLTFENQPDQSKSLEKTADPRKAFNKDPDPKNPNPILKD